MSLSGPRFLFNLEQLVDRNSAPVISGFTLDAPGKKFAVLFRPLPGRSISHVGVFCSSSVGALPVFETRLETVLAGAPTGALVATDSRGSFTPSAGAWSWVPLLATTSPAENSVVAAVVAWSSGLIGAGNSASFNYRLSAAMAGANPWPASNNGAAWSSNNGTLPMIGVRYSDGTVHPGLAAVKSVSFTQFNSSSSPNEIGNRFAVPTGLTIDALAAGARLQPLGQATLRLYDDAGTLLTGIDAQPLDGSRDVAASSTIGVIQCPVPTLDLAADSRAICALRPLNTTGCYHGKVTFADPASRFALFGDAWWVQRTGNGPFSEDTASAATISPRVAAFVDPPQVVVRHPGMCGGLAG